MPAPVDKFFECRLFFRDEAGVGYSEVYVTHLEPPDPDTLLTRLNTLVTTRKGILQEDSKIIYATASDVGRPGDIDAMQTGLPQNGSLAGTAMPASTGAHVRLKTDGLEWITRIFRGITTDDIVNADDLDPAGPWQDAFAAFPDMLMTNAFGVYHRQATARHAQYSFQAYTGDWIPRRVSHRDAGRPFGGRVGRRAS